MDLVKGQSNQTLTFLSPSPAVRRKPSDPENGNFLVVFPGVDRERVHLKAHHFLLNRLLHQGEKVALGLGQEVTA